MMWRIHSTQSVNDDVEEVAYVRCNLLWSRRRRVLRLQLQQTISGQEVLEVDHDTKLNNDTFAHISRSRAVLGPC